MTAVGYSHAENLAKIVTREAAAADPAAPNPAPPVDPRLYDRPEVHEVLAKRDVAGLFRAVKATGISYRAIAGLVDMSQSEVSEILAGRKVQAYDVLMRVADGLDVPRGRMGLAYDHGDSGAGGGGGAYAGPDHESQPPDGEVDPDMLRRSFLAAASLAVVGQPVLGELLELPAPSAAPLPSRLGMADVRALEDLTAHLVTLARQYGGQGDTFGAVADRATRLMGVPAADDVRNRLGSALAELHTEAGWSNFDAGSPGHAHAHFRQALELAREVGDAYQVALTLRHAGMAQVELDPNGALKLYQLGSVRLTSTESDIRTAALRAWLDAESAVALAAMDRSDDARRSIASARDGWEPPEEFQRADMDYCTGAVAQRIGMLETADSAIQLSLRLYGECRRDASKAATSIATIHVRAGEPDGLKLAHDAVTGVAQLRSQRARKRLGPLVKALGSRRGADYQELARQAYWYHVSTAPV